MRQQLSDAVSVIGARRLGARVIPKREHRGSVFIGSFPQHDHPEKSTLRPMTFKGWPQDALDFYVGLEADNSRTYFLAHKEMYDECVKAPFLALSDEIAREFGPLHVFRPNRDVRFAKDKSPYKTAAAAVTESEGGAAYYVQISSEGLYVGSGYYHLAPDQLERFRAAVADSKTGPPLAAAVAGLRKNRYEVASREALQRAP